MFVNGNDLESFSITLTISASGKFLKPILTTKGKTNFCLKKFDLNNSVIETFSKNGWTNKKILLLVFDQILAISLYKKLILVLD